MGFVEDFLKLYRETPHQALFNIKPDNSEYCTFAVGNRNSYLLFGSDFNEDCLYGRWMNYCKNCVDGMYLYRCELCYDCVDMDFCYHCYHSQQCRDSSDLSLCYDCIGCHDCFLSVGLRNKTYMILNEPYPKDAYREKVEELKKKSPEELWALLDALKLRVPRRAAYLLNTEDCAGDYLKNCQRCYHCFDLTECQDCLYADSGYQSKDLCDVSFAGEHAEDLYECFSQQGVRGNRFSAQCIYSHNLEYCFTMYNCNDCFGCVSLHRKQYHILNKPHSKTDYARRVRAIKEELRAAGQYGRFCIPSPYPYEDTSAAAYWPQ